MRYSKTSFDAIIQNKVSFARRFFAFIIDVLIIYLAASPLTSLLSEKIGFQEDLSMGSIKSFFSQGSFMEFSSTIVFVSISISLLGLFYWTALEYLTRQSIGKMLMKISIKSQSKDLKLWQVIVRNLTKAASVTSLSIIFIVDVIYMFFNSQGQRLTELLSRTGVEYASE